MRSTKPILRLCSLLVLACGFHTLAVAAPTRLVEQAPTAITNIAQYLLEGSFENDASAERSP